MISSIYASKLYRTSNRKSKIHAAFSDSSNKGLVTQLVSYLDEEYQKLAEEKPEKEVKEVEVDEESASPEGNNESTIELPESLNSGLGSDFSPEGNLVTIDEDISDVPEGSAEPSEDSSSPEEPMDTVEEITRVNVKSSTEIDLPLDVLKGSLNSVEETRGAERLQIKDKELWIYYNDDTNLNNIMTTVIEYLNASGYTNLEFNRLARSDNAMVFVISDMLEPIKPIEAIEG